MKSGKQFKVLIGDIQDYISDYMEANEDKLSDQPFVLYSSRTLLSPEDIDYVNIVTNN